MRMMDIYNELFDIAIKIENNTLSYGCKPLVMAGKKDNPADSLAAIAVSFNPEIANNIAPSKSKVEAALKELRSIMKNYDIEQLKNPIKELSTFLMTLDRTT